MVSSFRAGSPASRPAVIRPPTSRCGSEELRVGGCEQLRTSNFELQTSTMKQRPARSDPTAAGTPAIRSLIFKVRSSTFEV
jgi:hypothetical protein